MDAYYVLDHGLLPSLSLQLLLGWLVRGKIPGRVVFASSRSYDPPG